MPPPLSLIPYPIPSTAEGESCRPSSLQFKERGGWGSKEVLRVHECLWGAAPSPKRAAAPSKGLHALGAVLAFSFPLLDWRELFPCYLLRRFLFLLSINFLSFLPFFFNVFKWVVLNFRFDCRFDVGSSKLALVVADTDSGRDWCCSTRNVLGWWWRLQLRSLSLMYYINSMIDAGFVASILNLNLMFHLLFHLNSILVLPSSNI